MAITIRFKFHGKCPNHPRYNPSRDGLGAIKGGCHTCHQLYRVWAAAMQAASAAYYFDGERIPAQEAARENGEHNTTAA